MNDASERQVVPRVSQTPCNDYLAMIEDHFRWARGTRSFQLSPADFALAQTWQQAGVPVEAVLRGIDRTFENWRKRSTRARIEQVNSLAYCAQAIAAEAQAMANTAPVGCNGTNPAFTIDDLRGFITRSAAALTKAGHVEGAASLEALNLEELCYDLKELERRLTAIEENVIATLRANTSDTALIEVRCALERDLSPYRGKMSADQLAILAKQFLDRRLLEAAALPRLSLFYL